MMTINTVKDRAVIFKRAELKDMTSSSKVLIISYNVSRVEKFLLCLTPLKQLCNNTIRNVSKISPGTATGIFDL